MGISDLLKLFKPLFQPSNLKAFSNKRCAIDMMVWLYKGLYACNNNPNLMGGFNDLFLNFPLKMIGLLRQYNIKCIAVFDGKKLPAKQKEIETRQKNKEENLLLAEVFDTAGNVEESKKLKNRSIFVEPIHVNTLLNILNKLGVETIVAPYEADAEIAYLYREHLIDFAISEDSDLISYGVKKIAYKLDEKGDFSLLDLENLDFINSLKDINEDIINAKFLANLSHLRLVQFCVLLGCDYLKSPKGLGYKGVVKLFRKYDKFEDIIEAIKYSKVTLEYDFEEYIINCYRACTVFYYQLVYDLKGKKLVHLYGDELWRYFRGVDTIDDIKDKAWLTEIIDKNKSDFYGEEFIDYESFCNGVLDMQELINKKEISLESVEKYFSRYNPILNPNHKNN